MLSLSKLHAFFWAITLTLLQIKYYNMSNFIIPSGAKYNLKQQILLAHFCTSHIKEVTVYFGPPGGQISNCSTAINV